MSYVLDSCWRLMESTGSRQCVVDGVAAQVDIPSILVMSDEERSEIKSILMTVLPVEQAGWMAKSCPSVNAARRWIAGRFQ